MPDILIIDDEPLVRAVLRRILERHGYAVREAPDGRAGLTLWRHAPGDLVLTDLFMPGTDGIEVIVQLTRDWPQAKIIAMTGGAGTGDYMSTVVPAALELGARHLLMKPFTIQTLLSAISSVLHPQEGTSDHESRTNTPVALKGVLR
jgi:two-component system response regulator (stage 0 sporulation protein F)